MTKVLIGMACGIPVGLGLGYLGLVWYFSRSNTM